MSLINQRQGYAVMTEKLDAYAFESESLEDCKMYCRKGYVIAEQIPYVHGFTARFTWHKFWKPFYFKYKPYNILWLHFSFDKAYTHKTGKIVYKPTK